MREREQFVHVAEHEVALLEVVDAVARAHHALEVEAQAVRRRVVEREHALGGRRGDARAVDAQAVLLLHGPNSTVYQ